MWCSVSQTVYELVYAQHAAQPHSQCRSTACFVFHTTPGKQLLCIETLVHVLLWLPGEPIALSK